MMVMRIVPVFLAMVFLAGCAGYRPAAGARETMKEPLHTEAGIGITIWKVPVIGLGGWGFSSGYYGGLPVITHNYNYQAVPPIVPQGGVPAHPPGGPPAPVGYSAIYPPRPFDDPTLVIFRNASDRATLAVAVDERAPITLAPGQVTANLNLDVGDHQARVRGEVLTALGPRQIPEKVFQLRIDPRGRAQIIYLSEY